MRYYFSFRTLIFYSIFIILSTNLLAQKTNFDAGMFININAMDISRKDHNGIQAPAGKGFAGGFSIGASVKKKFESGIQTGFEIRYISKGSKYQEYINSQQVSGILKLNYIELPVLIGYTFSKEKINLILESGFGFAKLFQSEQSIQYLIERVPSGSIDEDFNNWDISWVALLKWSLNYHNANNTFLGFRFEHSILKIHNHYNLYNINLGLQLEYIL